MTERCCYWCGGSTQELAGFDLVPARRWVCMTCAPDQGQFRDPEFDETYQPTMVQVARLRVLRARLAADGLRPMALEPEDREFLDLNVERFLFELHEGSSVPEPSTLVVDTRRAVPVIKLESDLEKEHVPWTQILEDDN